jgi:hypothetical protein
MFIYLFIVYVCIHLFIIYLFIQSGYNTYRGWTETEYQNKHYNIDQEDEGT